MFIVSLNYLSSLEQVDSLLEEHIEFLKMQYEKKVFIASGRKIPRTGGVILAKAKNKEELNAIIEQDPFVTVHQDNFYCNYFDGGAGKGDGFI